MQFISHCFGLFFYTFLFLPFSSYSEECKTFLDLTYNFENGITSWPDINQFNIVKSKKYIQVQNDKYWYKTENYSFSSHAGTHIDAPCQFSLNNWCIDSIPLSYLIAPAEVVNVSEEIKNNTNLEITDDHFKAWENKNGKITNGTILLIYTGWDKYWTNKKMYLGDKSLRFPGLTSGAAKWLIRERSIAGIGIDTASIDCVRNKNFEVHQILSKKNIYILENIANMSSIAGQKEIMLYVFPMKIMDGAGAPCRIMAEISTNNNAGSLILKPSFLWIFVIFLNLMLKFL